MTFCKQYKCTTARIGNHSKYRYQSDRPDLRDPERLQLLIDSKFEQLKVAIDLEHWRKAFYSVEDIHGLMRKVKKTPKPSLLVVYYAKLTEIFWISSSHIFHAYAWFKLFTLLQKTYHKNLSLKDLQPIASSAVLAALLVVPYNRNHSACASPLEVENEKERNLRMGNLIGFELDPTIDNREVLSRSFLLSELVSKCVVSCASQEVKDLYNLLENEFLPLGLASKAQTLLVKISKLGGKPSASCVPEVQLSRYVPALEKLVTLKQLQQVSKVYQVMKIECLFNMIPFFDDFSQVERISLEAAKHNFLSLKIDHMRQVVVFGPESDGLRDHLTTFAASLYKLRDMIICPPASKLILSDLGEVVDKEHKRLLARKSFIEKRKLKEHERQLVEMEREEESRRQQKKITEEAEQKRVAAEFEQRKNQRILREVQHEAEKGSSKKKGAKQEMEKKLQKMAKTLDYLERAKREEAIPLVEAAFQRWLKEEELLHKREQQLEIELSRQRHNRDLREKNRLSRILENKHIWQERVLNHRKSVEDRRKVEREERIKLFIQARKREREVNRKKIVYVRTEEAKRKSKLNEFAEKQRQREREVEEKQQLRRGSLFGRSSVPPAAPAPGKYVLVQLRGKAECYS